jgi:hypothetical protein
LEFFQIYVIKITACKSDKYSGEGTMAISDHQIGSVLSAYTRQSKLKASLAAANGNATEKKYADVVSLAVKEENNAEEFDKISYNLRDSILKKE